jgi:hypothetical protein
MQPGTGRRRATLQELRLGPRRRGATIARAIALSAVRWSPCERSSRVRTEWGELLPQADGLPP